MSYMADRDHIAITTGDTSTTRSKVFVAACPVVRLMRVTLRDSSDTYSRIVVESEKVARSRRLESANGKQQANQGTMLPTRRSSHGADRNTLDIPSPGQRGRGT